MANIRHLAEQSKASQGPKELEWLLNRVDSIKPKRILEIGVHQGYSMETWMKAFPNAYVVGVDNDLHDLKIPMDSNKHLIIDGDSHNPSTGSKIFEALKGEVDFLFIDGDHTYDGVKQDFMMYAPLVRKSGIIAFDDMDLFDNPTVEVYKFWDELMKANKWSFSQTHQDSNGIGILYV